MQVGSESCDNLSFTYNLGLPTISGTNVKAAFSRTSTPARTALTNFPRFLCSRTLKRRHSLYRQSDETSQSQTAFLPSKSLDLGMEAGLAKRLLQRKCTPTDLIRIEKLQQKDAVSLKQSRDKLVATWLAHHKASRIISLKQKPRKVKIVVSLPIPRRQDNLSELQRVTLALLKPKNAQWKKLAPRQAWGQEPRQSESRHFSKLSLNKL